VWQLIESGESVCKASDWNSDRHTDSHIKIEHRSIRYHESECRVRAVAKPKAQLDSGAIQVTLTCAGEGETWRSTQVWQTLDAFGREVLAKTEISKSRPGTRLFQKCRKDESSERTPKPGSVASSAGQSSSDLRSTLISGRHCFAQKGEGSELQLDIDAAGAASFSVDVANPRTKHICSVSGIAKPTATGWHYVDDSQAGQRCTVDLDVSDRINFRLNARDCERRYCGARTSISALVFSARDKTPC
jgi:hypothetical protein